MTTITDTLANTREAFAKFDHSDDAFERGMFAGWKITNEAVEAKLAADAPKPIKPFEDGEPVQVELVDGWHKATIIKLGPVLCYVELDGTHAKAAVTLDELLGWNR